MYELQRTAPTRCIATSAAEVSDAQGIYSTEPFLSVIGKGGEFVKWHLLKFVEKAPRWSW